jgi:DNA-binding transcriptional MerR regulator
MGVHRGFFGDCDVPIEGHMELIDQIRLRARQDGVPLGKIDKLLKLPASTSKKIGRDNAR